METEVNKFFKQILDFEDSTKQIEYNEFSPTKKSKLDQSHIITNKFSEINDASYHPTNNSVYNFKKFQETLKLKNNIDNNSNNQHP